MVWGRWFGKAKVGATSSAPQTVLIEFECQGSGDEECNFATLSLTAAHKHIISTYKDRYGSRAHNIEPRGYLYPPKDPEAT